MNQIAVVQAGNTPERVIVLPKADFDALKNREGYRQRANGDLERVEGSCEASDEIGKVGSLSYGVGHPKGASWKRPADSLPRNRKWPS